MRFAQTIKLCIKNIRANKIRSLLTMLGIIIGISSVIILVSIASGSTKTITDQVKSLGTDLITVSTMNRGNNKLKFDDLNDIKNLQDVKNLAPLTSYSASVNVNSTQQDTSIVGTTKEYFDIMDLSIKSGRSITDLDDEFGNRVVVLGNTVASDLFGFSNPVGQEIKINGNTFLVVGVLNAQGNTVSGNMDDKMISPISTVMDLSRNNSLSTFFVKASSEQSVDGVMAELDSYLTAKLSSGSNNSTNSNQKTHNIVSSKQLLDTMSSVSSTLKILLGGIAGISLVVGGIGVMNVMLVSVTERTREIGIRKALGGSRANILVQFLIEALVICSIGGIIGIGLGVGASKVANSFGLASVISLNVILGSFLFSLVVGLIFGIYPAYKASKLNPIEALRFE
jgi:putative ABC transport system permease protein